MSGQYIHIRPKVYGQFVKVDLIDLHIPELNMTLNGSSDLVVRRPYPNKCYHVACRRKGRRAIDGLLIKTEAVPDRFCCIVNWRVLGTSDDVLNPTIGDDAARDITHDVTYEIVDREHDLFSSDMMLWTGSSGRLGDWATRYPDWVKVPETLQEREGDCLAPLYADPCMADHSSRCLSAHQHKNPIIAHALAQREITDTVNGAGYIEKRTETFAMPSIEPGRLKTRSSQSRSGWCYPDLDDAFLAPNGKTP